MKQPVNYGGQAVIEGVMMRGPRFFAVACRRANREIVEVCENVESFVQKWAWLHRPFLRGSLAIIDSMALGSKALRFSASVAMLDAKDAESGGSPPAGEEARLALGLDAEVIPIPVGPAPTDGPSSVNEIAITGTLVLGLVLGVGIFMLLPSLLANLTRHWVSGHLALNLIEGAVRLAIFLGYLSLISRMPDIQRIFQYHGAEHKTINAYEAHAELTPESVQKFSRIHPRCGTSFILIVLIVATISHAFLGWPAWYYRLLSRVLILPIVAGISYEIIRYAGRHREKVWLQKLLAPGLKTQLLTTREPTDDQVEVAIRSLNLVLEKDGALELPIRP
jgi:uncharacterized protein YqhQ